MKQHLAAVVHGMINGDEEQASAALHQYVVQKMRSVARISEGDDSDRASYVLVHGAYPQKVQAIKKDLEAAHSEDGQELKTSKVGDYVKIHLPDKDRNTVGAVRRTLRQHEGNAYSGDNVK